MGGSFGNLFDRLFYRSVPDFIDFHIGNFHWFIFNVADIFISLGVIFMILIEIIDSKKKNEALSYLPKLNSELMKIAKTGVIKKGNATRNVSKITRKINSL